MSACRCSCPVLKCLTRYHGYHCVYFAKLIAILAALENIYKHLERRVKYDAHTRLSVKAEATSADRTLGRYWLFHMAGVRETQLSPLLLSPALPGSQGRFSNRSVRKLELEAGRRRLPGSQVIPLRESSSQRGHGHPQALAPLPKCLRAKGLTQRGGAVQSLHPPRKHWVLLDPGNIRPEKRPEKRVHTCALTDVMLTGCLSDSSVRVREAPEKRKHLHGDRNFNPNLWRLPF